ncbi:MAG: hypothetical protein AB7O38_01055 [Pirellulaceae bacterium]
MSLLALGMIVAIAPWRADLTQRVALRRFEHPAAFREWVDISLRDHPRRKVLVLPAKAEIPGDLVLDWTDELESQGVVAIVVPGDLTVRGSVRNRDFDGGPLLFVDGSLTAQQVDKRGAPIVVLGDLHVSGYVLCEYNHGGLRVGGKVVSQAVIGLDHDIYLAGPVVGKQLDDSDASSLRGELVTEVFDLASDPEATFPDVERIRARIAAGLPILKAGGK